MKKNTSYIGITAIILLFGIFVVRNFKHHTEPRGRASKLSYGRTELPNESGLEYLKINGITRKMPEFIFTDQNNRTITNTDYINKVYVVEFFFTTCPTICPIMNRNMLTLDQKFGQRNDFGIASFTINPKVDTPIKLKEYAESYGVSSLHWHFLTGESKDIYELSNKGLNIFTSINPNVEGGFEHQGFFALIDKQGYIRCRKDKNSNPKIFYQGTETKEIELLKEDIQSLLEKE